MHPSLGSLFFNFFADAEGLSYIWVQGSRSWPDAGWVTDDGNPLPFMEPYRRDTTNYADILYFGEGKFYGLNIGDEITYPFICVI